MAPAALRGVLALEGASESTGGWSAKEIGGLVTTGVLILVLWLLFRRLKFPD